MAEIKLTEEEVVRRIKGWADRHPTPDEKLLVVGYNSYSPREIADEVRRRTEFGCQLIESDIANDM